MSKRKFDPSSIASTPGTVAPTGTGLAIAGRGFQTDANGRGVLVAGRCADCGSLAWPTFGICHACLGNNVDELPLGDRGRLYAFTEIHIAPSGWQAPYIVGYVDMPEGVRIFTHLDGPAGRLRLDDTVFLHPRPTGEQPAFSFSNTPSEARHA